LVVMMYVRFPLSLRNVEDLLFERGIDICHETVRHWWNRFGPVFAADIRRQRVSRMRGANSAMWRRVRIRLTAPPPAPQSVRAASGGLSVSVTVSARSEK